MRTWAAPRGIQKDKKKQKALDLVDYLVSMVTEIFDAETEKTAAATQNPATTTHGLPRQKLEAIARELEVTAQKLSVTREQLAAILQEISDKSTFSPEEAGRAVVAAMQQEEGGSWTGEELRTQWQLTAATLHKRRKEHRIISWRDPQHHFHYPKWQFTDSGALLPGIQEVLQIFRSDDEWRVMRYFLGERAQLDGKRPLNLLRDGQIAKVVAHARLHTDENTW